MQTRKIAYAVMGALMITSDYSAGCGKKENTNNCWSWRETHRLARRRKVVLRVKKSQLVRVMIYWRVKLLFLLDIKHNYQKVILKLEMQAK